MQIHNINTHQDIIDLKAYVKENNYNDVKLKFNPSGCVIEFEDHEQFDLTVSNFTLHEKNEIMTWLKGLQQVTAAPNPSSGEEALIFGKDSTQNIVSIEVKDSVIELFIEKDGKVTTDTRVNKFWALSPRKFDAHWQPLKGNLFYRYIKYYDTKAALYLDKNKYKEADVYAVSNEKEAAMLLNGLTYFKGMKVNDVSILSFDIETMGLVHDKNSMILLISNTFLKNGVRTRKLFAYDDYEDDASFIDAWCSWVREINPSIMCGHNIFGYDLPYMEWCADKAGTTLALGRDGSDIRFEKYVSKFRKDGSQDYDYKRCHIYGREIVDTMFLAYHFDFARKYESYGLKQIIKQENLEVADRQFYDASKIVKCYKDEVEWKKIKKYAEHDADDALALYNLMISAYFYLTPSIPKSFQMINYSASGSQINSFLIRSYLQENHSIPKADEAVKFTGAISDGMPGIYSNVFKVDVASLYPSIMLQYEVYHPQKDPLRNFLKMVQYFTKQRLEDKKKAKETGDRYYKELEQARKIVINSAYGLLGATGLHFNYPAGGAMVTERGREILKKAIMWATSKEYIEKIKEDENDIELE